MSKRDTTQVKTLKTGSRKPAIPESILDVDSQRYYVLATFVLIQAWKFYDLYVLHSDIIFELDTENQISLMGFLSFLPPKAAFIFKYFFLDSLLILTIPFLSIPKLSFTPTTSVILLFIMNCITLLFTCTFSFAFSTMFYSIYRTFIPEKELTIMEHYAETASIINQSERFKGKKTIRYAPDSSIKINPYGQQFCIRPVYNEDIKIPIRVESTYDISYLQINYHDLNNFDTVLNFTQRELKNFAVSNYYTSPYVKYDSSVLGDSNVQILEIPVSNPGYYSIKLATDKKDKMIRSYRSDTIISVCPEAAFVLEDSTNRDKCIDDTIDDVKITLLGVAPFTLYYEEEIDGKLSKLSPTVVPQLEDIDSPLNAKENQIKTKLASRHLKDITWAKSVNISIPITDKKLSKPGKYVYTINKIVDGFGNTINYTPDPNDSTIFNSFTVHPKPVLNLIDSNPSVPILTGTEKYLDVKLNKIDNAEREIPFNIVYKYTPNESDDENKPQIFTETVQSLSYGSLFKIHADKPGTYTIEQGSSNFCPCRLGSSSLTISSAKLPEMKVHLDPIVDNCVGTTGFQFNFDFSGTAPFKIGYKISRLDPNNPERVIRIEKSSILKSESNTFEYNFKPSSEGSYSIEFMTLSDRFYTNKVHYGRDEHRYVTFFKQRPRAYFEKHRKIQRLNCCNGESQSAILNLEGKAPFSVSYDIISPDFSVQNYNLKNVNENQITIDTPKFLKGGEYILSLKNVVDATACDVDFKGQEVHISVRNEVPQLGFETNETFEIVHGKTFKVPLLYQSEELIDLVYSYSSFDGKTKRQVPLKNLNPSSGLELSDEGIYKLVSFYQKGCPGQISYDHSISLKYISTPSLHVWDNKSDGLLAIDGNTFKKSEICQNKNDEIVFEAYGSAPFIIIYDVTFPNGRTHQRVEQFNNARFSLETSSKEPGLHSYTIKDIYDSTYTEDVITYLKNINEYTFEQLVISQEVYQLPSAKFVDSNEKYQSCVSSLHDLEKLQPILVELRGSVPVSLKLDIYHEYDGVMESIEFEDLNEQVVDLSTIYKHVGIGNHVVSIKEVVDANECTFDGKDESITIQISDVPKIRHLTEESNQVSDSTAYSESHYYCVGDQITYMLNGVSPFTVNYEFNSAQKEVLIQGNYFKRLAPGPGEFNIKSISDSSARSCLVDFTELNRRDLTVKIYDLPSVEIVQGDSIEEDIHEGEQVEITFLLTGTAPFKLTYIRKELDDSSKIVETEIIENIMTNEYHIMANLEGTYEAIEIQDKYCVARNHRI